MPAKSKKSDRDIAFTAALHHSTAALSFFADGEVKLVLSVPASELPKVSKMLLLVQGAAFDVVIPAAGIRRGPDGRGSRIDQEKTFEG